MPHCLWVHTHAHTSLCSKMTESYSLCKRVSDDERVDFPLWFMLCGGWMWSQGHRVHVSLSLFSLSISLHNVVCFIPPTMGNTLGVLKQTGFQLMANSPVSVWRPSCFITARLSVGLSPSQGNPSTWRHHILIHSWLTVAFPFSPLVWIWLAL